MHALKHDVLPTGCNPLPILVGHTITTDVTDLVQILQQVELVQPFEGSEVKSCSSAIHGLFFLDILFSRCQPGITVWLDQGLTNWKGINTLSGKPIRKE
jgi:hypothetical protein